MHIYMMKRGIKKDVDHLINQLCGMWFPFKVYKDKKTMPEVEHNLPAGDYHKEVHVNPIQLWEIVVPRESKDEMLNTLLKGQDGKTEKQQIRQIFELETFVKFEEIQAISRVLKSSTK